MENQITKLKLENEHLQLEVLDLKRKMSAERVRNTMASEYVADERLKGEVQRIEELKDYQIKDTVNLLRSMLSGEMPIETYYRFKQIQPDLLTTTEWLLVNMWETLAPIYEEVKRRRSEVNSLKLDIKVWNKKAEKYNAELAMIQKAIDMKDETFRRQLEDHKRERLRLTILNDKLTKELNELRSIAGGPTNLLRENEKLKGHVEHLVDKVELLLPVDFNGRVEKRVMDVEHEKTLLRKDNEYLATQDIKQSENQKSKDLKIREMQEQLEQLREQNHKYITELLQLKQKTQSDAQRVLHETLEKQNLHHHVDFTQPARPRDHQRQHRRSVLGQREPPERPARRSRAQAEAPGTRARSPQSTNQFISEQLRLPQAATPQRYCRSGQHHPRAQTQAQAQTRRSRASRTVSDTT